MDNFVLCVVALGICAFIGIGSQLLEWYLGVIPERHRTTLPTWFTAIALTLPWLLAFTSGYLIFISIIPNDVIDVAIAYYSCFSLGIVLRAGVPRIARMCGTYYARWLCFAAFLINYSMLILTIHFDTNQDYIFNILPHCIAVLIWMVYDFPFFILPISTSSEAEALLARV